MAASWSRFAKVVVAMSEAAALTEQIAGLLAEHAPSYQVDGDYGEHQWVECICDSEYFVDTKADDAEHRTHVAAEIAARLADSRPVVSEAAIRACAIHLFTLDRDRKGRGLVDWIYASDYEKDFFTAEARAALTAALPHMGYGRGEAFTDSLEPEIAESWADEEYRNVWLAAAWDECCREHERECDDLTYDDSGNVIDTGCDRNPYRLSPTGDDSE